MNKPVIKIKFVSFGGPSDNEFYQNYFVPIIEGFATVELSETPDFIFCGSQNNEFLKHTGVRIYFASEEAEPDFNMFDYAIGYNEMTFYDRFLSLPFYARFTHVTRLEESLKKHLKPDDYYLSKSNFCNFIYSNGFADKFREEAFYALNEYKHVDSAGRFLNNMPDQKTVGDKQKFMQDYRFSIAFSNCQRPGYADEKIFDTWCGGAIPIFWGDQTFSEVFNPKAYIDCTKCKDPQEIVEKVREIEESPEKYLAMQKEPIVLPGSKFYTYFNNEQRVSDFLKHILLQLPKDAKRTTEGIGNRIYKEELILLEKIKKSVVYKIFKKIKKAFKNK